MSLRNDLNKSDKAFNKLYKTSKAKVLKQYAKSLRKILNKFEGLFAKYTYPSNKDLARKEVKKLQKEFTEEIASLNAKVSKTIGSDILISATSTYKSTTRAFNEALSIDWNFKGFTKAAETFVLQDNLWLDSVRNANANLLLNTKRELDLLLAENARFDIAEGLRAGKPFRTVAKTLRENFGIAARRADTITLTEMHKGFSYGRNLGIEEAQQSGQRLGIQVDKVWKHNGVGKPRLSHLNADGQIADKETGLFEVGGELLTAPGLGTDPANNINCFIGETEIVAPTSIEKAYRRYYEGELVKITTRSGINVTATPNHPIMTSKGWVGIGSIENGDNLIKCSFGQDPVESNPNVNHVPISFSKLFDFLNVRFSTKRTAGVPEQFHSDGFNSDVDIVLTKSLLWDAVKSFIREPVNNKLFTLANFRKGSFFGNSRLEFFFKRVGSFFGGFVGFFDLVFSLIGRHSRPFQKLAFRSISDLDLSFFEYPIDNRSANPIIIRELIDRNSAEIVFDDVINVEKFNFSGHVYNLQTVNNYYLVSNIIKNNDNVKSYIIAHNCHCSAQAEILDFNQ